MRGKKRFKNSDVYNNTIVAYPDFEFFIYNSNIYVNRESSKNGNFSNKINHVPQGFISLHEINVNRPADSMVYPFITKDSARTAFRTVTTSNFQDSSQFTFGDTISGSYPLSGSINRIYVQSYENDNKRFLRSLQNSIELGGYMNNSFNYSSINSADANIIEVPSIFYGSQVKKGSVQLDYYITGTLLGTLKDTKKDGRLIETVGPRTGKTAGIILYEQGICILTGSYDLSADNATKDKYFHSSTTSFPNWLSFGSGMRETAGSGSAKSSENVGTTPSYLIKVKGTNKIPTLTMLVRAEKGEHNYSNNPTFIDYDNSGSASVTSGSYTETSRTIKNIAKSKYAGYQEAFEKITYISKIGIYDKDDNLLGIATLANPVKKTEIQDYLFKLRLDF
jgi:hypothetical protein